jgi:Rrf2 family protein
MASTHVSNKNIGLYPTERSSLMNIGKRVDYAIRALSYLAARPANHAVSRREIQEKQDIPAHFLSKIMKRLETGGLVQSYMGARGGFALKKLPAHITLKEVYECLEGPLMLMGCLDERERACRLVEGGLEAFGMEPLRDVHSVERSVEHHARVHAEGDLLRPAARRQRHGEAQPAHRVERNDCGAVVVDT